MNREVFHNTGWRFSHIIYELLCTPVRYYGYEELNSGKCWNYTARAMERGRGVGFIHLLLILLDLIMAVEGIEVIEPR